MDLSEKLAALEEIKALKARYFRGVDMKDMSLIRNVFTDDSIVDVRGSATDPVTGTNFAPDATAKPIQGSLDIIADMFQRTVDTFTSVHHGFMPEISITSPTTATGVWAMSDILRFKDTTRAKGMDGYGHYHETYEKVNGAWKIKTMRLTRLLIDVY